MKPPTNKKTWVGGVGGKQTFVPRNPTGSCSVSELFVGFCCENFTVLALTWTHYTNNMTLNNFLVFLFFLGGSRLGL